jgi:hypothetical protein
MTKSHATATAAAVAMPDLRAMLGSWDTLSSQVGEQSTALSRDAASAGLRLFEQTAVNASECMQAWASGAHRVGDCARAAEQRLGAAEDAAGVWNLECDVFGQTAQMAAQFAQDAWLALARMQAVLLQSTVAHNERAFERLVRTTSGGRPAPAVRASVDLPALPVLPAGSVPWPALAESITESARAWWEAVAASNTAAWRDAAEAAPAQTPSPPAAAARGRRRAR